MALRSIDDDHFAGPDEVTKPIDVSAFHAKVAEEQRSLVKDAKRALLIAALALSKAGDAVAEANTQVGDILSLLNKLIP